MPLAGPYKNTNPIPAETMVGRWPDGSKVSTIQLTAGGKASSSGAAATAQLKSRINHPW